MKKNLIIYKFILAAFILTAIVAVVNPTAMAASISLNPLGGGLYGNLVDTGLGTSDPVTVAAQLTNVFLRVLGTITILLMLYGGWTWLWARGNEEDITKAKDIIRGAIIGLLIILASYGLTQFVFYYLTRITDAI